MDKQHGSTVAVKEWMPIGKQPHDFTQLVGHGLFVLPQLQAVVHSATDVLRVAKRHVAFGDCFVRCGALAILPRPWVVVRKQNPMDLKEVAVLDYLSPGQVVQSVFQVGTKNVVLKLFYVGFLLVFTNVSKVTRRFEVTKRIEHAWLRLCSCQGVPPSVTHR